jgi:outer membrane lipoprotein-sorting protein
MFGSKLPIIGMPIKTLWHSRSVIRIELDGRKQLTKETKLFVFIDSKTHLPFGISANLGSITQVDIYENLKINPKILDPAFQFSPPKGWTRVTAGSGGWE